MVYMRSSNRGVMQIAIDGGAPTNMNAYSAITQWQIEWSSGTLANTTHTITITHISGTYIDIDTFLIN